VTLIYEIPVVHIRYNFTD